MVELVLDQAAGLRRLGARRAAKVIAITGGKGGVGKTLTAVNLGTALAKLGRSTMLLDADLGLANVDVLLGLKAPLNLEHVLTGECGLEDVIVTAPSGLRVVPASSGSVNMATLGVAQHAGLVHAFSHLAEPLDVLLVDTGAAVSTDSGAAVAVATGPAASSGGADAHALDSDISKTTLGTEIFIRAY